MTAFTLIIVGGGLIFAALMLRAQPLPRLLTVVIGVCGIATTTAGALRL